MEILTGATAGGMAGVLTCPLDVVKTRIQTQLNPQESPSTPTARAVNPQQKSTAGPPLSTHQRRHISTSSPSTYIRKPGSVNLDTSSVITGLKLIYKTEGFAGWFRGVGPRALWTSVQSGTMLVLYQALLRHFEAHPIAEQGDGGRIV